MAQHFEKFLSKLLDEGAVGPVTEYSITASDAQTESERKAYEFIRSYAQENGGKAPSIRALIEEVPAFTYREGVTDSFAWVADKVKNETAIREVMRAVADPKTDEILNSRRGNELIEHLQAELESIKMGTSVRDKVGTSIKDTAEFREEYERRKRGESHKTWRSKFSVVNDSVGGYASSNVYVVYGESGRGKSAVTMEEAVEMAFQGANVLDWVLEMGRYEAMVRLYTSISSRIGATVATVDGVNMEAGFSSKDIRHGTLPEDFEERFFEFLDQVNDLIPGNITIRAVDDEDFVRRDLRQLEADIIKTEADVVIIDPFYYLDYEKNTSKTTGGDAANTSMKLRRLAGRTQTVIIALTQADAHKSEKDEDGVRELRLPERNEVKKTSQLLEDAALLIAVDTNYKEGRGLVGINKGRDGGEDEYCEITYLPQIGVIKEIEIGELAAEKFTKQF